MSERTYTQEGTPRPHHASPRQFPLTFRTFTKLRSRAKHGAGVSTPFLIYFFHGLRGKRAKRALREMLLLAAVHPYDAGWTHLAHATDRPNDAVYKVGPIARSVLGMRT